MIKEKLKQLLEKRLGEELSNGNLPALLPIEIELGMPKQENHGDFATNYALLHSKSVNLNPRNLGEKLVHIFSQVYEFESVEIAGPGFINFHLKPSFVAHSLLEILNAGSYPVARPHPGAKRKRINIEFVSVNPNGPITIGSGRGAAYGDCLSRILGKAGYEVNAEYYINDALNSEQMRLFTESVRYYLAGLESKDLEFPENGYRGDYVKEVASDIHNENIPSSLEASILQKVVQDKMIAVQRRDLAEFGVRFQTWFSEQSLHDNGEVEKAIEIIRNYGRADSDAFRVETVYEDGKPKSIKTSQEPGPMWFRSHDLGDDKDRVLIRADGRPAYIAGDLAYMKNKLGTRGFDKAIIILGPDHHGYVPRLNAVCKALGFESNQFEAIIYQIVRFVKDGKLAPMRKRDGNIYELKDLVSEVGVDAARFFYLMRGHESPIDFDIDLATKKSDENPVFYVQYAHARICSILKKADASGLSLKLDSQLEKSFTETYQKWLYHPQELRLIKKVSYLEEEILRSASDYGVHRIANYAIELAREFHSFYQACKVIDTENQELSLARLSVCKACQITLQTALSLLGVSAPESMTRSDDLTEDETTS